MRIVPSRYLQGKPLTLKKVVSKIAHLSAPLKGLSLSSKLTQGDPLTGPILDNWVVDEDKIRVRPGTKLELQIPGAPAISTIIPHYGTGQGLALAAEGSIYVGTTELKSGFTQNDWSWTTFSNLGDREYTVMANGAEGVWSWDGGTTLDAAPVVVTSLSNTNPAVVTVGAADIDKFHDGDWVRITGATGTGMTVANGTWQIASVGSPANTFELVGVDTSTGGAPQTTGVAADPQGSLHKEVITAPSAEPWIDVDLVDKVLAHMNRLFFADSKNLAIYYLPVQQKTGELKLLPLNAVFRRGGHIVGMYTWTLDGGAGMDDQLVVFSSNGEAVIYSGVDPDTDFRLVGIFRFDHPMSKHSVINYGGDLYVLTSTGLFPMTGLIRSETENFAQADKNVVTAFWDQARDYGKEFGWGVVLEHATGMAICNLPMGGRRYRQMVRFMPNPIWASWSNIPARCWQWMDSKLYFGTDDGRLFVLAREHLSDNGQPITADVQFAWSSYKTPALKHWKMVLPYVITDGNPKPYVDMKVDYDTSPPRNQPDVTLGAVGAEWDTGTWALTQDNPPDGDYWAMQPLARGQWQGVAKLGRVGAPRLRVSILDCSFALAGMDVIYEPGAAL